MAHYHTLPSVHISYEIGLRGNPECFAQRPRIQTRARAPIADRRRNGKFGGLERPARLYKRILYHRDVKIPELVVNLPIARQVERKLVVRVERCEIERTLGVLNREHIHRSGNGIRRVAFDRHIVLRLVLGLRALDIPVEVGHKRASAARIDVLRILRNARILYHRELEFAQDFVFRIVRNLRRKAHLFGFERAQNLYGKFAAVRERRRVFGLSPNLHGNIFRFYRLFEKLVLLVNRAPKPLPARVVLARNLVFERNQIARVVELYGKLFVLEPYVRKKRQRRKRDNRSK